MFAGVGMQSNNRKKKTIQASNVTERKWKDREGQGSIVPAMKGRRQNTLRDSSVYLEAKEAFTTYNVAKKKNSSVLPSTLTQEKGAGKTLACCFNVDVLFFSPILSATDS